MRSGKRADPPRFPGFHCRLVRGEALQSLPSRWQLRGREEPRSMSREAPERHRGCSLPTRYRAGFPVSEPESPLLVRGVPGSRACDSCRTPEPRRGHLWLDASSFPDSLAPQVARRPPRPALPQHGRLAPEPEGEGLPFGVDSESQNRFHEATGTPLGNLSSGPASPCPCRGRPERPPEPHRSSGVGEGGRPHPRPDPRATGLPPHDEFGRPTRGAGRLH